MRVLIGWMLLATCSCACAADVYVCKGANGVMAYQQEPCPKTSQNVAHDTYQLEPDGPQNVQPYGQSAPMTRGSTGALIAPAPSVYGSGAAQAPVAYQCTAGQRTWVQYSPCPTMYMRSVPVNVDGYTDSGEHFSGASGTAEVQAPVQQQGMDRDALCGALGNQASHIQHSGQSDVYERNVAKRKYCGQ